MAQKYILPVRCEECGALFDLWYDLQAQEQLRKVAAQSNGKTFVSLERRMAKMLEKQTLCWECRKTVLVPQDENAEFEYEMSIGFE